LAKMIEDESKINVVIAKNPDKAVILGCGKLISNPELLNLVKIVNK